MGVLLCRLAHQALKGEPWMGSYSVVGHISHLKEHLGRVLLYSSVRQRLRGQPHYCSAASAGLLRERGYGDGSTPYT